MVNGWVGVMGWSHRGVKALPGYPHVRDIYFKYFLRNSAHMKSTEPY